MSSESQDECGATPPGYPTWTCRLPSGHDGPHKRGPLTWEDSGR